MRLAEGPTEAGAVRLIWARTHSESPLGACHRAEGGGLVHLWALALPGSQSSPPAPALLPLLLWQGPPCPFALALLASRLPGAVRLALQRQTEVEQAGSLPSPMTSLGQTRTSGGRLPCGTATTPL